MQRLVEVMLGWEREILGIQVANHLSFVLQAEDERAAVKEQMLLVGNGLVEKLNGVNGKARLCLSEGLQQTCK